MQYVCQPKSSPRVRKLKRAREEASKPGRIERCKLTDRLWRSIRPAGCKFFLEPRDRRCPCSHRFSMTVQARRGAKGNGCRQKDRQLPGDVEKQAAVALAVPAAPVGCERKHTPADHEIHDGDVKDECHDQRQLEEPTAAALVAGAVHSRCDWHAGQVSGRCGRLVAHAHSQLSVPFEDFVIPGQRGLGHFSH